MSSARRSRTRSSDRTSDSRPTPTQWAIPIGAAAHPTRVTSRWHLPSAFEPMASAPDWTILATHTQDSIHTTADQLIKDDPAGHVWIMLHGLIEVCPGNTAASLRHDQHTPAHEREQLQGGIGFFPEIARLSGWLAIPDLDERRRRLCLCVEPAAYPQILTTPASRFLAARHVDEHLLSNWGLVEADIVVGYLCAITTWASAPACERLYEMVTRAVCNPDTTVNERAQVCDGMREWRHRIDGVVATPEQVQAACCLRVISDDTAPPHCQDQAERLLGLHHS